MDFPNREEEPGLSEIKQVELYTKWRLFLPLEYQDIMCPKPDDKVIERIKNQKRTKAKEKLAAKTNKDNQNQYRDILDQHRDILEYHRDILDDNRDILDKDQDNLDIQEENLNNIQNKKNDDEQNQSTNKGIADI